jgi:hypothetical protein
MPSKGIGRIGTPKYTMYWRHLAEKRQGSIGAAPRNQAQGVEGDRVEQVG